MGMRAKAAEDAHTIFNAPGREIAETYLKKAVEKYLIVAPKLAN